MKKLYMLFGFMVCFAGLYAQNTPPIAIGEIVMPVFDFSNNQTDTTIIINVLMNDIDPDGDEIQLYEVKNRQGQENIEIAFNDSLIYLTMKHSWVYEQGYEYRVKEKNDPGIVSNWATLVVNPCFDPNYPVARNDSMTIYPGETAYINVLENDYHPLGDTLISSSIVGNDSIIIIGYPQYIDKDYLRFQYMLSDTIAWTQRFDIGFIYLNVAENSWYDSIDINNINARFNCFGNHFWNLDSKQHFKVPNGSNISSIFSQTFWIGGLDENEGLHLAAERYRQLGYDYWTGPVSDVYDSVYDRRWHHIWKLNRNEIEYHKAHWWETGYEPISDILSWPGNGDVELGQSEKIAPFEDKNENGLYEPLQGDAPIIKGDQALFFVFNDDREEHTETEGIPLGIEIHAMAYGFDKPGDSVFWNTIFLQYKIINRSDTAYNNVYIGQFTDTDLGNAWDDRIESDVENGMFFCYNGLEYDQGSVEYTGYGEHPPAIGIMFLGGPYMVADGIDNPKYDALGNQIVDESINGLNFGDGIIDNERMGMQYFVYMNNGGASYMSDPNEAGEYYYYLSGKWLDGTPLQYGGVGHPLSGSVGPECRYLFPRDSDPYNWGTYGLWPNEGFNQNGLYWTDEQSGLNPSDRRGLGSIGPFHLADGEEQTMDMAYIWARDYDGTAWSSAELLKERAAYIKQLFENNPDLFSKITPQKLDPSYVKVFPNPVRDMMQLTFPASSSSGILSVYSIQGVLLKKENLPANKTKTELDCSSLPPGLYLLHINLSGNNYRINFIKH
ncbi:MAG: T9SS type A sorting domain-containing protein [Bacteroidales bacterium]|nr:T9SS type A sorting domain-containing protein [Bacteroidales bacterium]